MTSTLHTSDLYAAAVEMHAAGMTVIPVRADHSKAPALRAWQKHQTTADDLAEWFGGDHPLHNALGVVTGAASGGLELVELEGSHGHAAATVAELAEASGLGDLWHRVNTGWKEASPSGGLHYFIRTTGTGTVPGNTKLAATADRATIAETRGEGGQAVAAPTPGTAHPSGRPWVRLSGGPHNVPTLTPDERDALLLLFRTLDETPDPAVPAPTVWDDLATPAPTADDELRPGDDYEARTDWAEILTPAGWTLVFTRGRTRFWRRPGKSDGISATTGNSTDRDRLYVFTTSTEFDAETPYTKMGALTVLQHGGDHSAAARALRRAGYGKQRPRPAQKAPQTAQPVPATTTATADPAHVQHRGQARMAYRLAAAYTGRLLYVRGLGWHVWDGHRWAADEKDAAKTAVLEVLRTALAESLTGDSDLRTDVRKCESAAGINGVLNIAEALPELRASVAELDADPHLLNTANGTLDLRTRTMRPHDPADRITKVTTGAYTPDADSAGWAAFLAQVLPDGPERAYLQRVIGQGVYGAVREHLFPVLIGTGSNGKGTAYGAVVHALGDYATIINPDLLMMRDRGSAGGPEMMTLRGARLVVGSETEGGKQLDAALMKRLTGGDELTARHLYQEPVTWHPSHQIVYVTNHLPKVKGNDPAVWRRISVVPFDVTVPADQRDAELPERLRLAADAILTWAVEGWFDYVDNGGMRPPTTVQAATADYETNSDDVKRFVQDHCLTGPHFHTRARELFHAWATWAADEGAEKLSEKRFGADLDRLGYTARRTKIGAVRDGIGLPAEDDETPG